MAKQAIKENEEDRIRYVRISISLNERLEFYSRKKDDPVSKTIRRAIQDFLDKERVPAINNG